MFGIFSKKQPSIAERTTEEGLTGTETDETRVAYTNATETKLCKIPADVDSQVSAGEQGLHRVSNVKAQEIEKGMLARMFGSKK